MISRTRSKLLIAIEKDRELLCSPQISPSESSSFRRQRIDDIYDKEIDIINATVARKIEIAQIQGKVRELMYLDENDAYTKILENIHNGRKITPEIWSKIP